LNRDWNQKNKIKITFSVGLTSLISTRVEFIQTSSVIKSLQKPLSQVTNEREKKGTQNKETLAKQKLKVQKLTGYKIRFGESIDVNRNEEFNSEQ
ncbi:hypothetical protein Bhyg_05105, partial [Pseudolycoriella hygida]